MDAFFNRDREAALRRSSSPLYKGSLICDDDLTISFQGKRVVQMRQCWAVGFSILELSKWHMASLYYDRIIPALGRGNVAVVMSDTDSFLLATSSADEESTMRLLAPYMDFSNLDPEHPLYSSAHARVPGLLKNEVPRAVIEEVVALKSKTYTVHSRPVMSAQKAAAYTVAGDDGGRVENKAKGVTEASRRRLTLRDYRRCLRNMTRVEVEEHNIRSVRHTNQLVRGKKVAFSSFDDKRYLICPIHSVPYGSVVIRAREKMSRERGEDFCCFLCDEPDLLC